MVMRRITREPTMGAGLTSSWVSMAACIDCSLETYVTRSGCLGILWSLASCPGGEAAGTHNDAHMVAGNSSGNTYALSIESWGTPLQEGAETP